MFDLLNGQTFAALKLTDGIVHKGPWTFHAQNAQYPGFKDQGGNYVPMSAVVKALATGE